MRIDDQPINNRKIMKHPSLLLTSITPILALAIVSQANAAPTAFGGHWYDVVAASGLDWPSADTAATSASYLGLPGHLVTISSAGEDAFVNALVAGGGFGEVWAGAYQNPASETDPEAGWTWVNGEGTFPGNNLGPQYAAWSPLAGSTAHPSGQPDDFYGPASEQYMGLNLWGPTGGWNDEGYLPLITGYVVEYQSTPDCGATLTMLGAAAVALGTASRRLRR